MRTFGVDRFTALLTLLGLLGASLILLRTATYGPGLTSDSAIYMSFTRNLLEGNGFVHWDGSPLGNKSPLFPLVLAFVGLFGPDAIEAARYVNAAASGLTVFVVAVWLRRRIESRFLVVWAGCVCALSTSLAQVSAHAWTEPLFILLVVSSLFALDRFLDTNRRSFLLLAGICAGMACLTRHIGVTLIGSGLLILLLQANAARPARAMNAAIWAAVAMTPVAVWISTNFLLSGFLVGQVRPTGFSPLVSLHVAIHEISLWTFGEPGRRLLHRSAAEISGFFVPGHAMAVKIALTVAVFLAIGIGAGYALTRFRRERLRQVRNTLTVPLVFLLAYALFLVFFLPLAGIQLEARYLAPTFPPFLFAATVVLNELAGSRSKGVRSERSIPVRDSRTASGNPEPVAGVRTPVLICCLSLWLVLQIKSSHDHVRHWTEHGGTEVHLYLQILGKLRDRPLS